MKNKKTKYTAALLLAALFAVVSFVGCASSAKPSAPDSSSNSNQVVPLK